MSELFKRAKEIFLEACDLPPDKWDEIAREQCGDNAELLNEVRSLLAHHDGGTSPIVSPTVTPTGAPEEKCPDTIGTYRVIRELGRGGMGVVYLALQEENGFKRHVAIKVLKRGMDTATILQRFALERQVLGVLNHPNVARLYHAGETDQGLPYFVMEYVDGQPINRFCDTHRLRIGERLALFRKVCAAVHHAHQHLVVHRDLKPRNILVTSDGEPKLLDFGIAKLINPDLAVAGGGFTTQDQRVMTPEYASPEQVRGDPISTASDIYAMGVLLYEIVSGHRPYHVRNRVDMDRYICEEDPERPSTAISRVEEFEQFDEDSGFSTSRITPQDVCRLREDRPQRLRRRLTGDVDNIVMMAMRKEPQRRYQSAEQFSADLQRHMDGLPVLARRDTFGYRCRKFVGRNRAGVGAAAAIVILLVGGIVGTASGLVAEREQRERADKRFDQVRELAHTFMFDFHDAIQKLDGSLPARELLVTTALEYLEGLGDEAGDDPLLRRDLADGYQRVGDIRGGTRNPSLGDTVGAMENYRTAQRMRTKVLDGDPGDPQLQHEMSKSLMRVGDILMTTGNLTEALAIHQEALGYSGKAAGTDPKYRRSVAFDLNNIGAVLAKLGRIEEASGYYSRVLAIRRESARAEPRNELYQRNLSVALNRVGGVGRKMGDPNAALELYHEAMEIRVRLLESNPTFGREKRDVMVQHFLIAEVLLDLDQPDDALHHVEQCLPIVAQRATDNPTSARAHRDVAMIDEILGRIQLMRGDTDAALGTFQRLILETVALNMSDPDDSYNRALFGKSYERLGDHAVAIDNLSSAIDGYRDALDVFEAIAAATPESFEHRVNFARVLQRLGSALSEIDGSSEARMRLLSAQELYETLLEAQPRWVEIRLGLASTLQARAALYESDGDDGAAAAAVQRAITLLAESNATPATDALRQRLEDDLR